MKTNSKKTKIPCPTGEGNCCVEALLSVDERGQMVLPKKVREKAGINPGDKLALVCFEKDGKFCCLSLIKSEELVDTVRGKIAPLVGTILGGE